MDAALTLDADTRYLIRLSKVNRAHGTQAGAEAAGYAFFHIRLGDGLQEFRRLSVFPLRNIIRGFGIAVDDQGIGRPLSSLKEVNDAMAQAPDVSQVSLIGTA